MSRPCRSRPKSGLSKNVRSGKPSSTRWLQRQLNDPYVVQAKTQGYRSRAAFKLAALDDKFGLLRPGLRVVDLGAAPGGWTQLVVARLSAGTNRGKKARIVAVDKRPLDPVAGAHILVCDLHAPDALSRISHMLGAPADLVLSDMSPSTTGHGATDHLRIIDLVDTAYGCARALLSRGGHFVAKVFQGGAHPSFLTALKQDFRSVRHFKPPASRKESREIYVVAQGYVTQGYVAQEYCGTKTSDEDVINETV